MGPAASLLPACTADVAECVRDRAARRAPVRIVGAGHWLDGGHPVAAAAAPLSVKALTGIVDYTPGDLTLTACAGTPLAEIATATAAHDQWLALDPFGPADGTIGATIATASAGPLAHAFGTPRDIVLGVEAVTGEGAIVRGGGRVVKNVAGFDLTRLFTGAWGTLGVITEVTVRLRARPEIDESWMLRASADPTALRALLDAVRAAPIAAMAVELVSATLAQQLAPGADSALLVRLGGGPASVRAQRDALTRIAPASPIPNESWRILATCERSTGEAPAVVRLSHLPSRIVETWIAATAAANAATTAMTTSTAAVMLHATPDRGVVRCIIPAPAGASESNAPIPGPDHAPVAAFLAALAGFDGTLVIERLPLASWPATAPHPVRERLAQRIKDAFDPAGILNPGILRSPA